MERNIFEILKESDPQTRQEFFIALNECRKNGGGLIII